MENSCKIKSLEFCLPWQKKNDPLDKSESIMEKPLKDKIKILKLVTAIFINLFFFHQTIALQEL